MVFGDGGSSRQVLGGPFIQRCIVLTMLIDESKGKEGVIRK